MENVEEKSSNGDTNCAEDGKKVNGTAKPVEGRGKCGKCTKSRAGKESSNGKQQAKDTSMDDGTKALESLKKSLTSVQNSDEKVTILCEKYADLLEENRKLSLAVKQGEKKIMISQKEKEIIQADHSKIILTRGRLENLCRELQRQNKTIKEESLDKIKIEEEKRKELSDRFNVTLNEITTLMQSNTEQNNKLRDENKALADRFKIICEQYELRESHVDKLVKQNQLEGKLAETKFAKAQVEMMHEKELLLRELKNYQIQLRQMTENETQLRSQITMYSEKYEEFQGALSRSNEVFNGFKAEMDKMSKKIVNLEKETHSWKTRWEKSHQALIEMAADKQKKDEEFILAGKQVLQLQKLCRTLQEERSKQQAKLKDSGDDSSKDQSDVQQTPEIDQLLNKQLLPVVDSEPIKITEETQPSTEKPSAPNADKKAAKQTEKQSSVENADTNNSVEPVPETVPEKPDDDKANKQTPNNNEKKKSKEAGRKKKK